MSFADQYNLGRDVSFIAKVQMAIIKSAIAIRAEDPETADHAKRDILAKRVLEQPDNWAHNFALGVVSNAAITTEATDGDIEFTVNSIWNAYAGI